MKFKKTINILVIVIALLSGMVSSIAIFSNDGPGLHKFKSMHNQEVMIYGKGLYKDESLSAAVQGIAQDIVTLSLGIPLLLLSLYLFNKGTLKGKLLLSGTLLYFLYSYVLYTFFAHLNYLFLAYTTLMTTSLYAFILSLNNFKIPKLPKYFKPLPEKFIGYFLIISAAFFGLNWVELIIGFMKTGIPPHGLDHYTTMVVQGMDLGFLIPSVILSGILLIRKHPAGYLFSSIVIIKLITMLTALVAMVIGMKQIGDDPGNVMLVVVSIFTIITTYLLYIMLKAVNEDKYVKDNLHEIPAP